MSTPAERGNDLATDALRQMITLAGATLALTVTFMKDVLGDRKSKGPELLPFAWGLLIVAVLIGWLALARAARTVGTSDREEYVFADGALRNYARAAQCAFLAGLALLVVFFCRNLH
jgi:hypothetical protein